MIALWRAVMLLALGGLAPVLAATWLWPVLPQRVLLLPKTCLMDTTATGVLHYAVIVSPQRAGACAVVPHLHEADTLVGRLDVDATVAGEVAAITVLLDAQTYHAAIQRGMPMPPVTGSADCTYRAPRWVCTPPGVTP